VLDPGGAERFRIEGYLPKTEFRAHLEMGLARIAFMRKGWPEAETRYSEILRLYPNTYAAAEALYWTAISHYKATNDHTVLGELAEEYKQKYKDSVWALKASVFSH
jgi:outer membrane protein assembly factor BamD (BamD/ComL family)